MEDHGGLLSQKVMQFHTGFKQLQSTKIYTVVTLEVSYESTTKLGQCGSASVTTVRGPLRPQERQAVASCPGACGTLDADKANLVGGGAGANDVGGKPWD